MKLLIPHINKKSILLLSRSFGITLICVASIMFMGVKINSITKNIVTSHNQLAKSTIKLEQFDSLVKDAESVTGIVKQLNAAIPTMDTMPIVIDYMNALEPQTQTVMTIRFDPTTRFNENDSLGKLNFSLDASGQLSALVDLLKKMEEAPYLISIQSLTLSPIDDITNQIDMRANGSVYIQTQLQ